MNDTKLILFTLLFTTYLNRSREIGTKMNTNAISVAYSKWLSLNSELVGYDVVSQSMDEYISTKCFL